MARERLQKLLARAGVASRREAERWIQEGRVTVDGKPVFLRGVQADPSREQIQVDGRPLPTGATRPAYYMLYKPNGVITSVRDPQRRRDLREWLNRLKKTGRFFYAGRLDFHSEGLLLLTTDGELTYRLTHPRYGVSKRYRVKVRGMPKAVELERLRTGILLGDGWTAPAAVRRVNASDKKTWIEIEIREGKNRQVRRMFEALGYLVEKLTRTGYGPLDLGQLRPGEIRELSAAEVRSLHQAVAWDCDRSESKTKNEPWGEHHRPSSKRRLNR